MLVLVGFALAEPVRAIPGDPAPPSSIDPGAFCPEGDGFRSAPDALVMLRRVVGVIDGWCEGFHQSALDVGPCPPVGVGTCVSQPDGFLGVSDAQVVLLDSLELTTILPSNASYVQWITLLPPRPALGDLDRPPLGDFPNLFFGDEDCDGDGEVDGPEEAVLDVMVDAERAPPVPYQVCLWMEADAREFDFDAPPFAPRSPFPGPEDHDAFGDGRLDHPAPPPDHCATVCPEGLSDPELGCAATSPLPSPTGNGRKVRIGPFLPKGSLIGNSGTQEWSVVVDPDFDLDDEDFSDNIIFEAEEVTVVQCPDVAPDLKVPFQSAITVTPDPADQFDPLTFRVSIENAGSAPVESDFDVDLYLDYDRSQGVPTPSQGAPFPPGDAFATYSVAQLGPLDPGDPPVTAVFPPV